MFDTLKRGFNAARDLFAPLFSAMGDRTPTRNEMRLGGDEWAVKRNEMRLGGDEWAVKRKLGRSFFTRQLNPNTRAARIASLTNAEYLLAKERGWL